MIAIDSLSGVGTSSVAREVATRLGWFYLDTGAMYRAATLALLRAYPDLDLSSKVRVPAGDGGRGKWPLHADNIASLPIFGKGSLLWPGTELGLELDPENFKVFLGDEDVTEEIRSPSVEWHVRAVAGLPFVRQALLNLMRGIILETGYRIVVEGRDITTVVAPEAGVKVILEADREVRLERLAARARQRNARRGVDLSPPAGRGGIDGEGVDIDYLLAVRDNFDMSVMCGPGGTNPAGNQKPEPNPGSAPNPQIRRDVRPGVGEVYTIDTTHWSVWRVANWIIKRLLASGGGGSGADYRLENSRLVDSGSICKNTHLNHGSSGDGESLVSSSGHWCAVAGACCDFDNPYNQNPSDYGEGCDEEELAALQYLDETDQLEQR